MKFFIFLAISVAITAADPLPISRNNSASENGRFVGGKPVSSTATVPFMATVFHTGPGFLCSGVIVELNKILTTAECVYAYAFEDPIQLYVGVGGVDISVIEPLELQINVMKVHIHPGFHNKEAIYYNNLAVLTLVSNIIPTTHINVINLPDVTAPDHPILPGVVGNMAGWGGSDNNILSHQLELVSGSILGDAECKRLSGMVLLNEFCTDPPISGNACKYDHGSPFVEPNPVYGNILLGIVNYAPCTAASFPTVYTGMVPEYVAWIRTIP